jgi:hypothetical protein
MVCSECEICPFFHNFIINLARTSDGGSLFIDSSCPTLDCDYHAIAKSERNNPRPRALGPQFTSAMDNFDNYIVFLFSVSGARTADFSSRICRSTVEPEG